MSADASQLVPQCSGSEWTQGAHCPGTLGSLAALVLGPASLPGPSKHPAHTEHAPKLHPGLSTAAPPRDTRHRPWGFGRRDRTDPKHLNGSFLAQASGSGAASQGRGRQSTVVTKEVGGGTKSYPPCTISC